jgi:CRP-like cAMP-binding protein
MDKRVEIDDEVLFRYHAKIKHFKKGEYLAKAGSRPKSLYYIYSGLIKITNLNEEGIEFLHGFNHPKEIIGIGTYMGDFAYYNDFIAIEDVEVREISLDQFEFLIKENADISRKIITYLSDIINIKTITLTAVLGNSPKEKILFLLDKIKSLLLEEGDDQIPFTRQEMANFLGMRVETIIRSIKELEDEGVLKIAKGKIFY